MNTGFYKNLDENFEQALSMAESNFNHEELLLMLEKGNIPQKQFAAFEIERVNNEQEAELLVSNLTGCDGKIREAIAFRINREIKENPVSQKFFIQADTFANASIDINGNICRLVIDTVAYLINDKDFALQYQIKILNFISEAFKELDSFIFRDKKYVINKQLFKLYWSLEALKLFADKLQPEILYPILKRASIEREYTIREKVAQIIRTNKSPNYIPLIEILKADENYYVRKALE